MIVVVYDDRKNVAGQPINFVGIEPELPKRFWAVRVDNHTVEGLDELDSILN